MNVFFVGGARCVPARDWRGDEGPCDEDSGLGCGERNSILDCC